LGVAESAVVSRRIRVVSDSDLTACQDGKRPRYWVFIDGELHGPLRKSDFRALTDDPETPLDAKVYREGDGEWLVYVEYFRNLGPREELQANDRTQQHDGESSTQEEQGLSGKRFQCDSCGDKSQPSVVPVVSLGGWILFSFLFAICFPLCWIGLLMKNEVKHCAGCGNIVEDPPEWYATTWLKVVLAFPAALAALLGILGSS
jgi:hypothetical protein